MRKPTISVIMGAYNAAKYLEKAVDSILSQSFNDFEFIVVNDGSKDNTGKILDEYAAKDPRMVIIHQENMGHAASLNKALKIAKGPLIARMDADDIALPQRFEKQVAYFAANPEIGVLGTAITLIDEHDRKMDDVIYPVSQADVTKALETGSPLAHPTVMARKTIYEDVGGYRPAFDPGEDYEIWLRIAEKYKIDNLPEIHLLYRQHSEKLSFTRSQHQILSTLISQLASKARLDGRGDLTKDVKKLDPETLKLFGLSTDEQIALLLKTYSHILYMLVSNNDDEGVKKLFISLKDYYKNPILYKKMKSLISIELYRQYFVQKKFAKAYGALLCALPSQPVTVFKEAAYMTKYILLSGLKK